MDKFRFEDNQLHSTYSDGAFSPQEIFEYNNLHDKLDLTISDHVDSNTDWFDRYVTEIKKLRQNYPDFSIKVGCEVKIIDESGALNTREEILKAAEVVIGTVHHFPKIKLLSREELIEEEFKLTKLLAQNKKIDILGHPFSMVKRLYNAEVPKKYIEEVYQLCVKNGIKFEYNKKNSPPAVRQLVVDELAKGNGKNFSFGSDMHRDLRELGASAFNVASPVTVLVTGAGAGVGQSIIKAVKLSALKIRLIAVDNDYRAAGLYRADRCYTIPRCDDKKFIPEITKICREEKVDLLLVGTDVELSVLAAARKKIQKQAGTTVIVSEPTTITIADDKWETVQFLKRHGFAYPKTWRGPDLDKAAKNITFPAVVKPRIGARSIGFRIVHNQEELAAAVAKTNDIVIQELLGADDDEYTCSSFFYDGRCYGVAGAQRWLRNGDTYKAVFKKDPELEKFIAQVGAKLKINGPCNFQLRKTKQGPIIFEINCRFSGTTGAVSFLGFNVVNALIQHVIFKRPLHQLNFKEALMLRYWNEVFTPIDTLKQLKQKGTLESPVSQTNIF